MSYILDALKKAEAERHGGLRTSGPIPPSFHVHAQRQPAWRKPWLWAVLSASAVVAGGMAWMGGTPSPPQTSAQVAETPHQPPQAGATPETAPSAAQPALNPPSAPAVPAPGAPASAPAAKPAAKPTPTPPLAQTPAAAPKQPIEKPKAAERKPAEGKTAEATVKAARKPQQEDAVAAASPPLAEKARPAPEPPVGTLRDLPAQIQQEVPRYSVGGYIYSPNKADRSVLIDKRLLREGDEIAPGFTIERMTQTGMVLNYKGYRYRASY